MDVSNSESKIKLCEEQNCKRIWNVRSMNQGKLEVDNKDMERGNIKILGINEQEWARMGEFNSGDMVGKNP